MSSVFATGSETVKVWSLSHSTSLPLSAVKSKPIADLIWLAGGKVNGNWMYSVNAYMVFYWGEVFIR